MIYESLFFLVFNDPINIVGVNRYFVLLILFKNTQITSGNYYYWHYRIRVKISIILRIKRELLISNCVNLTFYE